MLVLLVGGKGSRDLCHRPFAFWTIDLYKEKFSHSKESEATMVMIILSALVIFCPLYLIKRVCVSVG
jgi:hypothetical protein